MARLVTAALETAKGEIGVREVGENRGARVESYLREAGVGPGNPWCAAFVYWCIDRAAEQAGVPNPFVRTAYCPTIENWAEQHDILFERPQEGDVFLSYGTVRGVFRACHTGFVSAVNGAGFDTVEGNTNIGGSREGIGVFARRRTNGANYRFVRWGALVEEPPNLTYALFLNDRKLCDMPVRSGRSLCPIRRWGEALGFAVDWNDVKQIPVFDGKEVPTETVIMEGVGYAPIRDLVEAAGLRIVSINNTQREVRVAR